MSYLEAPLVQDGTHGTGPAVGSCGMTFSSVTAPSPVRGLIVDWAWLAMRAPAWDELLANASHPTPALSRGSLEAHRDLGEAATERFAVVEVDGRLAALAPVRTGRLGLRRVEQIWASAHLINATPLIARWATRPMLEMLLDVLAQAAARTPGGIVRFPLASIDDPGLSALLVLAGMRGWAVRAFDGFERACFLRRPYDEYLDRHVTRRARRSLVRRRRALQARGELSFGQAVGGPALAQAIDAFLALEAEGWKGRRRTALASSARGRALARRLFAPAEGGLSPRADWLALDGRPLAVSLSVTCRGTTSLVKIAYDESCARFAPGVLLEHEIIRSCCEDGLEERLDSNSLAGGLLHRLYPDREAIADVVVATDAKYEVLALDRLISRDLFVRQVARLGKQIYWRLVDKYTAPRSLSRYGHQDKIISMLPIE